MNESIYSAVAAAPGTSVGVSADGLRKAWEAACAQVEALLLARRSVIFPNLGHFIAQQHVTHSGTWGARSTWTPAFNLLPAFSQSYSVSSPPIAASHLGATTPILLNITALAVDAGLPRYAAANALKDIVREIGSRILNGVRVVVDMTACRLEFHGGRCNAHWGRKVVDALKAYTHESHEVGEVSHSPRTRLASPRSRLPQPPSAAAIASAAAPPAAALLPSRLANNKAAPFGSAVSDGGVSPACEPREQQPAPLAVHDLQAASVGLRVPQPPSSARSSVRRGNTLEDVERAMAALPAELSPHARHKYRKHLFRRMRTRAYEDSWQQSLIEKQRAQAEEAAQDREKAEIIKETLAAEEALRKKEREQKREEDKKILQVNQALIQARRQLAAREPALDIFSARLRTRSAGHDVETLNRQVREREEAKRLEQEADVQTRIDMERDYGAWLEAEKGKRNGRRRERMQLMEEYENETKQRRECQRTQKDTELRIERSLPGLRFSEEHAKSTISEEIRRENEDLILRRSIEQRDRQLAMSAREKEEAANFAARDKMLRDQERLTRSIVQRSMKETWTQQMEERKKQRTAAKHEERTWKGTVFLRNESSDDES